MEPPRSLAAQLSGEPTSVGTMLKSMSVTVAEALGYTPIDFLFVDRQHGSPVTRRLEHVVRAADLNDLPVVVRVPRGDESMITYLLDCGVRGIMLPQVEDPATVESASSHVRFADGRSMASTTRATGFGAVEMDEYAEYVDRDLALLPMIESAVGLDAAADVAALPETTALVVGPGDLAFSLGVEFGSDDHHRAIESVFEAAASNDCPVGIFVSTPAELDRYDGDASFVVYGKDLDFVTSHLDDVLGEGD